MTVRQINFAFVTVSYFWLMGFIGGLFAAKVGRGLAASLLAFAVILASVAGWVLAVRYGYKAGAT